MSDTTLGKRSKTRLDLSPTAQQRGEHNALSSAEPVQGDIADWLWPAADVFVDYSTRHKTLPTCSEVGPERIRLLKIQPGRAGNAIERVTKAWPLSKAENYTALSLPREAASGRHRPAILSRYDEPMAILRQALD